jgi:hypothetical protein
MPSAPICPLTSRSFDALGRQHGLRLDPPLKTSRKPAWRASRNTNAFGARINFHWLFGKRAKANNFRAPTAAHQSCERPRRGFRLSVRATPLAFPRSHDPTCGRHQSPARVESFAIPHIKKMCFIDEQLNRDKGSEWPFCNSGVFSLFETLAHLAQALLQASTGQQDRDNVTKLAWTAAPNCN